MIANDSGERTTPCIVAFTDHDQVEAFLSNFLMPCLLRIIIIIIIKKNMQVFKDGVRKIKQIHKYPVKNQIAADNAFYFFHFFFQRKYGLMFHVNPLPSRGFT